MPKKKAEVKPENKEWRIRVRYVYEGDIVVYGATPEDALEQVGIASIEGGGGEMVNWAAVGKPMENA